MQVFRNGAWLAIGAVVGLVVGGALASQPQGRPLGSRDARDAKGRKIPERYLPKGEPQRSQRISEIYRRRQQYRRLHKQGREPTEAEQDRLYRPFLSDKAARGTRESTYVRVARSRGLSGDPRVGAEAAGRLYGEPVSASVLQDAYRRGLAAWASGGHRPGASGPQWAAARVASLLVGGKTAWTADKDLFGRLPSKVRRAIVARIPELLSELERDGRGKDAAAIRAAMER